MSDDWKVDKATYDPVQAEAQYKCSLAIGKMREYMFVALNDSIDDKDLAF